MCLRYNNFFVCDMLLLMLCNILLLIFILNILWKTSCLESIKVYASGQLLKHEIGRLVIRVFQYAQKSKDLRGWLAKYVVIDN